MIKFSLDSCNSCKRLGTSSLHELYESKFPFVSRIEFIRPKLSIFFLLMYPGSQTRDGQSRLAGALSRKTQMALRSDISAASGRPNPGPIAADDASTTTAVRRRCVETPTISTSMCGWGLLTSRSCVSLGASKERVG